MAIDIVTVFYNEQTRKLTDDLFLAIRCINVLVQESDAKLADLIAIDNTVENRGFAKACNIGARKGAAEIVGFLNPDVLVDGPFLPHVRTAFSLDPALMVTGCRFGKPQDTVEMAWRLPDWICGAAMFIRRSWFEELGGFDERYVWSWEETDFLQATLQKLGAAAYRSIDLPLRHLSPDPSEEPLDVILYKHHHLVRGMKLYKEKWKF